MAELDRRHAPALGPAPDPRLPAIRHDRLANGLGVVMLPSSSVPIVELELVVGAGSSRDPAGLAGLADLSVHLFPEGAAGLDVFQIAERLARIGAELKVGANNDMARVRISVVRSNAAAALEILADLVRRPSFPNAEIERLLAEREIDLLRSTDDPGVVAARTFAAELFGADHPYGAPTEGTIPSVRTLTRAAFIDFYRRAYAPANATLLAVGDFDPGALQPAMERAFGDWQGARPPAIDVSRPEDPGWGIVLVDRPGSPQSELRVGHVGVAFHHPDAIALRVLNHLIGGAFTSRLNLNLRERRGWTYGVRSRFVMRRGPGPFVVGASVATEFTRPAIEEIWTELERIVGGPIEEEERSLAVNGLTLGIPLRFKAPSHIADRVRELVVYELPDDWWDGIQERYRAVTVEDLERVARAHVRPEELLTIVVGDAAAVGEELAAMGPIERRSWKPETVGT